MNLQNKQTGIFLLLGAFMITVTMALHPVGGPIDHLRAVRGMIIGTHTLAILSIPVLALGFWGIMQLLGKEQSINVLAFVTIFFGLIAAMLAAATNGLVVPFFLDQPATNSNSETVSLILNYSFSLNRAMDYIFIGGCCLGVGLWSVSIIHTKKLPVWLGYLGILLSLGAVVSIIAGFGFTDLFGFRAFIAGLVSWIFAVGIMLTRK